MTVEMARVATVPAAKQIRPTTPIRTPLPIATRMSRPEVPAVAVGTFPVRVPLDLEVRGARTFGSGGIGECFGGDRRDHRRGLLAALPGTPGRRRHATARPGVDLGLGFRLGLRL